MKTIFNIRKQPFRQVYSLCLALLGFAFVLGGTTSAQAQGLGWEGETGVFVTPVAYTAPVGEGKVFGKPLVAFHYFGAGNVAGNFYQQSITEGIAHRFEFGYTRQVHQAGGAKPYGYDPVTGTVPAGKDGNAWAASFFSAGMNTFHAKANIVKENYKSWVPAISAGFIARTNVSNNPCNVAVGSTDLCSVLGHPRLVHTTSNADIYLVATKLILKTAPMPILITGGVRATNAEVFGMVGNTSEWSARGFASAAFIFAGPAKSQIIFGSEISQEPTHPQYLDGKKNALFLNGGGPSYVVPSTISYAVRVVPNPKYKFNIDFGFAQTASDIGPTNVAGYPAHLNLEARHQMGLGITYGF